MLLNFLRIADFKNLGSPLSYSEFHASLIHRFLCFTAERLVGISKVCAGATHTPNLDSASLFKKLSITSPTRILPLLTVIPALHRCVWEFVLLFLIVTNQDTGSSEVSFFWSPDALFPMHLSIHCA